MRLFSQIFLIFALVCCQLTFGAINLDTFQQESLKQHNFRRQQHCVPALILNSTISTIAQNYANKLSITKNFAHSGVAGLGENLAMTSSSAVLGYINGSKAVDDWYAEIASYNFNAPDFSSATGHFTQVVWKATTQVGTGIALTADGKTAYVVANYYTPGNYIGQFAANVPAVCSGQTTTTAPASTTEGAVTTETITPNDAGTTTTADSSALALFVQEVFKQHNFRRRQHCAPALILSSSISTVSQNYANYMAANNVYAFSGAQGLGENLFKVTSTGAIGYYNGSNPVENWYSQKSNYNFASPGYVPAAAPFTQLVWKATTQIGVGMAKSADGKSLYIVVNYYPQGNVMNQFARNVQAASCSG